MVWQDGAAIGWGGCEGGSKDFGCFSCLATVRLIGRGGRGAEKEVAEGLE